MFVTVLYRMANSPHVDEETIPFEDVLTTDYYYSAVNWGVSQGILFGVSSTSFAPQEPIRRQDAMILLDRYAHSVGNIQIAQKTDVTTSDFADGDTVDTYALASVEWALQHGIYAGRGHAVPFAVCHTCPDGCAVVALYRICKIKRCFEKHF